MYIIELRTIDYELKSQYETELPFILVAEYGDTIIVSHISDPDSMSIVVREEGPYKITEDGIELHYH